MQVKIKKLNPNAIIPTYAKGGDAGMDLVITDIKGENKYDITYGFGISIEIPEGFVGLIFPSKMDNRFPKGKVHGLERKRPLHFGSVPQ